MRGYHSYLPAHTTAQVMVLMTAIHGCTDDKVYVYVHAWTGNPTNAQCPMVFVMLNA